LKISIVAIALFIGLLAGSYLLLQSSRVQTYIIQKITAQLSGKTNAKISIGKVDISFFNQIILSDIVVATQNNDTILYSSLLAAKIDSFNISNQQLWIGELTLTENKIIVSRDSTNRYNFSFILDSLRTEKADTTTSQWQIACNQFNFYDSKIGFSQTSKEEVLHFFLDEINLNISEFANYADSAAFKINNLSLKYNNALRINQLSAQVQLTNKKVEIEELYLKTDSSVVNNMRVRMWAGENQQQLNDKMNFDFSLDKSQITLNDLSKFIPALSEMHENIEVSGRIYGDIADIKGKDLVFRTGKNTQATFDFYVNGIQNMENMYLFVDLKNLETTVRDITNFKIVRKGKTVNYLFPSALYDSGLFQFKGNFSGFLSDFVAFGTLKSKMGTIKTDISVIPGKDGKIAYNGKIVTSNFEVGKLFKIDNVGEVTFNGRVNGDYQSDSKKISGLFKGEIASAELQGYKYKNINLDGYFKDKMFDGMMSVNDSNLQFSFIGAVDLSKEAPSFDFSIQVEKVLPANLHLFGNIPQSELAFNMTAQFTGNKLDNLKGVIAVDKGYFKNKNGLLSLDGIKLISIPGNTSNELLFNSEYFDIVIQGNYQFQDLAYSVKKSLNQFIPSLKLNTPENFKSNVFTYRINAKHLDNITEIFLPGLVIETPFLLYGLFDSDKSEFELEGSIPGFTFRNVTYQNIFLSNKTIDEQYVSKLRIKEIQHESGVSFRNFSVNAEIADDRMHNTVNWYTKDDSTGYSYIESNSLFSYSEADRWPEITSDFLESQIYFAEKNWQIDPFKTKMDSTLITINQFNLHYNNQSLEIDGNISTDSTQTLILNARNIDLEDFQSGILKKNQVKGILNSSIYVSRIYNRPILVADANINQLEYQQQLFGDLILSSTWNPQNAEIESKLDIMKDKNRSLSVRGSYKPETQALNYKVDADSLPLQLLETVIGSELNNFSGTATGKIAVTGSLKKILMNGAIKVAKGGVMVDFTKVKYITDDTVFFKTDTIQFKNMTIRDENNNSGILNGILVHDNFRNMLYDINVSSPKIKVLGTTIKNNEIFYGDAFAKANVYIKGRGAVIKLSGSMVSLTGTNINISMEYENPIAQYDFLKFINATDETDKTKFINDMQRTDFTVSLNVEVTPSAKIQLIYNSQIGDIIKGEGEGIFFFEMNKYGDISLSGDYTVTRGDYLFTLQNVLNKRFTIAPGGTMVWSGDPYNAIINLNAIYKVKTSLSDLQPSSYGNSNFLYQRIPVECIIHLSEELINPTIKFDINFPDENEKAKSELQQYFNTDEEINKQILSLIVLGKFYTPEYVRGQFETSNPNMLGTTASELFSNQLSNWLSQISKSVDVGFKYRPGNAITNDELELALSTQIFNDRVILNGNIGNNVNTESKNSSQIVGDVDVRVKLTPNGKVQLKAYNHSNNDLIYETAPYTQGVGISFKEEYNSFQELMHKIGTIFKKKEE